MQPIQDVRCIPTAFANAYIIGRSEEWVLVDAGLPGFAGRIRRASEQHFGAGARPRAIVLTHGHWDHAGSAAPLASYWNVPVYVHALEMPYVRLESDYAPADPTIGGPLGLLARLFPSHSYDLRAWAQPLGEDGVVPGLPEWRCLHTPGHTHGHICLFRESDRTLIAGDALATMDMHSLRGLAGRAPVFCGPPEPFTVDWNLALSSMHALAGLRPRAVAAGHGQPISGDDTADRLHHFTDRFRPPEKGRYAATPARADSSGIIALPPPAPDPAPKIAAAVALGAAGALLIAKRLRSR